MHSPSDHTINGKRYDLELQIYHVAHVNTAEEEGSDGEAAAATHRRRMEAAAPEDLGESSDDAHGDVDTDDPRYQIQENAKFKYAAVSLLFSINDHD